MTIQEAIREAEEIVEGGKRLIAKEGDYMGSSQYIEFLQLLVGAAKKGAAEDLQQKRDEEIEKSKQLTLETVGRAVADFEETIHEVENEQLCLVSEGHRFGTVLEPALHTALAALKKCMADLMVDDADAANPRVRVVHMNAKGPEDMDKILKQVEGDLEKIFREAAEGKKEDATDER